MIVDDDPINRMVLQGMLEKRYHVEEACDGMEAISLTYKWRPHLILMDVMMPNSKKTIDKEALLSKIQKYLPTQSI